MLGMYLHMHWSYQHPCAPRTWDLTDWRDPAIRHGILPRLLDAVEAYCGRG